jgi:hypothetical protein
VGTASQCAADIRAGQAFLDLVEVDFAAFVHRLVGEDHGHGIGQADFQVGLGASAVAAIAEEAFQFDVDRVVAVLPAP